MYMDANGYFFVVTGPNGSGKTVFIKQAALIVVLAQVGCFVPAKHATVCVRHKILSRLENSDDMEHNLSTFKSEMKTMAHIMNSIQPPNDGNDDQDSDHPQEQKQQQWGGDGGGAAALVLIDELGRGTSNIDGTYNNSRIILYTIQ